MIASAESPPPAIVEPAPPAAQALAPGVWLIPGAVLQGRQPDGNTVVFAAPDGLVVMDTGRHRWHRQAILDLAAARNRPVVAVINSHWHLDHVSGNPALRAAWPGLTVYASSAIDDALTGFLARSAADAQAYLASGKLPPETAEDIRGDLATVANGQGLKPDVVVDRSATRRIGGLSLRLNLAANAATDGDVWVYDPRSRIVATGDLVTLPSPYFDTACPQGWRAALDQVWATPFRTAIPGHGAPMTRAQFGLYRMAFNAVVDCAASPTSKTECAAAWADAVAPLLGPDPGARRRAERGTEYYVQDVLRAHGGKSASCKAA